MVALVSSTVTAGDRSIEFHFVEVVHMDQDLITERWAFTSDPTAVGEFFASLED